jgi:hypothetical protein
MSGAFLTLSLCSGPCLGVPPARITEVLDPKGLKKGMNKTGHMRGLTHSGREWQNTYWEGKNLFLSASFIQQRKRPNYNLSVFAILYFYCQCPWLSINFFSDKGNCLASLPTVIEAWCICKFWPCWNAAKPQRPCQTVAFGSQHYIAIFISYVFSSRSSLEEGDWEWLGGWGEK